MLTKKQKEYLYDGFQNDYREDYKGTAWTWAVRGEGVSYSSEILIRDDTNYTNVKDVFENLDLYAQKVIKKYGCQRIIAYSIVCYLFRYLFQENIITINNGFSNEAKVLMSDILDCAYNGKKFDVNKYPFIKSNYMKYRVFSDYEDDFLINIELIIERIGNTLHSINMMIV